MGRINYCLFLISLYLFLSDGSDFNSPAVLNGALAVGGNVEICFRFTIIDDDCVEDKESFEVELVSSDSYVDIHISSATVTIWDNDCEWLSLVVIGEFYAFLCFQMHYLGLKRKYITWERMLGLSEFVLNSLTVVSRETCMLSARSLAPQQTVRVTHIYVFFCCVHFHVWDGGRLRCLHGKVDTTISCMCTCSVGSAQCSGCVVYGPGAMAAI